MRTHYADDEANTELKTVLMLKVGGQHGRGVAGIHWHVDPGITIRYLSDETPREDLEVETDRRRRQGQRLQERGAAPQGRGWRQMDCVDCHNRPTHVYRHPPTRSTSRSPGPIDKTLPFIKREGLRLLQADYPSHEAARAGIAADITAFYAQNYPDLAADAGRRDHAGRQGARRRLLLERVPGR